MQQATVASAPTSAGWRVCAMRAVAPRARTACMQVASLRSSSRPASSTSLSNTAAAGFVQPHLAGQSQVASQRRVVCRATLDDPELEDLVARMEEQRVAPPARRERLENIVKTIDDINSHDPAKVPNPQGVPTPYRVLYSDWVTGWVKQLDPKASDELLILAKGRNIQSWKLSEIKRDAYPPNSAGVRMWQSDRKKWLAERLEGVMKEAGYEAESVAFVKEVMLNRDIPDPRDMRRFDVLGPLGTINFKLLEQAAMIQTLKDAEALVFMERSFPQLLDRMDSAEVLTTLKKELSSVSRKCTRLILDMKWSPVQQKLVAKALPTPKRLRSIMLEAEGTAASSTHPGDWRYKSVQYD